MTRAANVLAALLMQARHPATTNSPNWVVITVPGDFIEEAEAALAEDLQAPKESQ